MNCNVLILSALFLLRHDAKDVSILPVSDVQEVMDVQDSELESDDDIIMVQTNYPADVMMDFVEELRVKPADKWMMPAQTVLLDRPLGISGFEDVPAVLSSREELAFRRALKRAHDRAKTMPGTGSRRKRK
jgi:hypothetical protein